MRDEHVKDAAQDVAEDVTQDVAEDVLGAAEDRSIKVHIVARAIFQRRNPRPTNACRPPRCPWATREGRAREGRGAGRFGRRATGRGAGPGLRGPGGVCLPRLATTAAAIFVQLALRYGRNWAAQWHLARAVASASGGAALSASMLIIPPLRNRRKNRK